MVGGFRSFCSINADWWVDFDFSQERQAVVFEQGPVPAAGAAVAGAPLRSHEKGMGAAPECPLSVNRGKNRNDCVIYMNIYTY